MYPRRVLTVGLILCLGRPAQAQGDAERRRITGLASAGLEFPGMIAGTVLGALIVSPLYRLQGEEHRGVNDGLVNFGMNMGAMVGAGGGALGGAALGARLSGAQVGAVTRATALTGGVGVGLLATGAAVGLGSDREGVQKLGGGIAALGIAAMEVGEPIVAARVAGSRPREEALSLGLSVSPERWLAEIVGVY